MEVIKNDIKPETDIELHISTGLSRQAISWKSEKLMWSELIRRLSRTTRTRETEKEFRSMPKSERDDIKDVGGFVGGLLKGGRRKAENLQNRCLITLDIDNVSTSVEDVWDAITMFYDNELVVYSTHSHSDRKPRLRLIIPTDRKVLPDEYQAISRRIAKDIGIDMFDDTTYEPSRLMYWPSTPADSEYVFLQQKGELLDSDKILDTYLNWRDVREWPVSNRQGEIIQRDIKKQEDPFEKKGMVGAFCRTYSISEAIESFLSDVYEPTSNENRYTFKGGSTVGGLVVYEDKFAFSHHSTDPIGGMLCNSFDLVRLHKYGLMDEDAKENTPPNRLPSYTKMTEIAQDDEKVKRQIGRENLKELNDDFEFEESDESWLDKLTYDKKGIINQTIDNAIIILQNHTEVKGKLVYDEFANRAIVNGNVPWTKQDSHDWTDTDDSGVRQFLESTFGFTVAYKINDAKNLTFDRHKYHPVRDYLNSLKWDGVKRLETIFNDYLGSENTIYEREVAKIHLVGAVARIFRPGVKYDTMVTLAGPQGMGKSTFIDKLSKGWYSDSMDVMRGKEAAELIQGVWHVELGELNATKKSDKDAVKAFLSKTHDIYRVAYAQHTTRFPRQCVFWGTTNDVEFLRDPTGDRRTYPIDCMVETPTKTIFGDLDEEVDQIWAEAVELYKKGTKIHLTGKALELARIKQLEHKEDTPLSGLVDQYLERMYPANWDDMELSERLGFLRGDSDTFTEGKLTYKKDRVCVLEVWQELLGKRPGDLKPINSREINDILRGLQGWEPVKGPITFGKIYGKQRGYKRKIF